MSNSYNQQLNFPCTNECFVHLNKIKSSSNEVHVFNFAIFIPFYFL